ncbi:hypothetical protein NL108_010618, partial [Boleophthalmus pectinirostris]
VKLQGDVTAQMTEIQRLKAEQLKELKQEFMKQEEQLKEVKKNSTTLERKLEYERYVESGLLPHDLSSGAKFVLYSCSLQCGRQIAQLKEEYEEMKRALEVEASKLRQNVIVDQKNVNGKDGVEVVAERHPVTTHQHGVPELKDEMGKPGSDAGMPGIEDSEVGKIEDNVQFGKNCVSPDHVPGNIEHLKPVPLPANPAQLPNPIQAHRSKDQAEPMHHRQSECLLQPSLPPAGRFFDENESPVDPQHGSKLADYNGDDGNVGEYEADKQAELAYNEEEDGDGGEEDVQ